MIPSAALSLILLQHLACCIHKGLHPYIYIGASLVDPLWVDPPLHWRILFTSQFQLFIKSQWFRPILQRQVERLDPLTDCPNNPDMALVTSFAPSGQFTRPLGSIAWLSIVTTFQVSQSQRDKPHPLTLKVLFHNSLQIFSRCLGFNPLIWKWAKHSFSLPTNLFPLFSF